MNEIVTRIHHLNPVEVVLDNATYFRDVLGSSARAMGMLDDWSDRLGPTALKQAYIEQEARIAAAITEGKVPAPRLLIELPGTPAVQGPNLRNGEFGAAHGGNHPLYTERLSSLIRQITDDLRTPDGVPNRSGFGNSAAEALARQQR